jgi:hypothetical protein
VNIKSILEVVIGITLVLILAATNLIQQHTEAFQAEDGQRTETVTRAPAAISGDNVYVTWWTNKTANGDGEVMFRASNDNGATFGDKINLSNNTVTNSVDAEIAAEGGNVMVTWWERNSTSNEPVAKVSTDNGATFGPMLMLANNETIGEEEGEPGSEATAEEE